jgi:hypothetical protein
LAMVQVNKESFIHVVDIDTLFWWRHCIALYCMWSIALSLLIFVGLA